ncbi:hypothetical protein UFOVP236_17 [uncultured Caudovirales phage]|uniref:Large polyvalent protein associated domain-containing protein n=1 Tax=uncultured Caudovirales phage TaxID=2100421 RepID=A0A6J7WR82_9CAUD|nr:hypothetical protein UFOVP236_17 [uncultured Caudovirales phage]
MDLYLNSQDARNRVSAGDADAPVASGIPTAPRNVAIPPPSGGMAVGNLSDFFGAPAVPTATASPSASSPQSAPAPSGLSVGNASDFFTSPVMQPQAEVIAKKPVEETGVMNELGRGLSHGAQVTMPKAIGNALEFFGAEETGKAMVKRAEARETSANKESEYGQSLDSPYSVRGNIYEAADNAVLSVAPGAAGAAVGAAVGSVVPVVGTGLGALIGYGVGSLASLPVFYGSQGQETYDKVKKAQLAKGADKATAESEARIASHQAGSIEAGGEVIADVIPFAKIFKPFAKPAGKAAGTLIKDTFFPTFKEGAKTVGKTIAGETVTEMAQTAGEAAVEGAHGAGPGATWAETEKVIMPTILMSLIPGMAGAGTHAAQVNASRKALENPATDEATRVKIVLGAVDQMRNVSEDAAQNFALYAGRQIQTGKAIEIQDDAFYKKQADFIRNGTTDPAQDTAGSSTTAESPATPTRLDDMSAKRAYMNLNSAISENREGTLSLMAALFDAQPKDDANGVMETLNRVAQRLGVVDQFNALKTNQSAIDSGNQMLSNSPQIGDDFIASAQNLTNNIPQEGVVKFERPTAEEQEQRMQEETDLMYADEGYQQQIEQDANSVPENKFMQNLNVVPVSESVKEAVAQADQQAASVPAVASQTTTIANHLSDVNQRKGMEPIGVQDVVLSNVPPQLQKVADAFGVKLVGYTATGSTVKGFTNRATNEVYVNTAALNKVNGMFLLGHEVWHQLEGRNPALAAELASSIVGYLKGNAYAKYSAKLNQLGYSKDKIDSEIAGDVMGLMFNDRKFWRMVGQKNPSIIDQIKDIIDQLISAMRNMSKGRADGLRKNIQDIEVVRDLMSSVASELAQEQSKLTQDEMVNMQDKDPMDQVRQLQQEGRVDEAVRLKKEIENRAATLNKSQMTIDEDAEGSYQSVNDPMARVQNLLRQGKTGIAAKVFKENNLFQKTGKGFDVLQKEIKAEPQRKIANAPKNETPAPAAAAPAPAKPKEEKKTFSPKVEKLRSTMNSIIDNIANPAYFNDTINALRSEIGKVEAQIKALSRIDVKNEDGTVTSFKLREETDENPGMWGYSDLNAYDRGIDGFVSDKPSNKQELLNRLRMLNMELEKVRDNSIRGKAALFRKSAARMADSLMVQSKAAIEGGAPREEVNELFNQYMEMLYAYANFESGRRLDKGARDSFGSTALSGDMGQSTMTREELEQEMKEQLEASSKAIEEAEVPTQEAFISQMLKDVQSGKLSIPEAMNLINKAAKAGEISGRDVVVKDVLYHLVGQLDTVTGRDRDVMMNQITSWASSASREGLLRFDDFVDIFAGQGIDIPQSITLNSHVALSTRYTAFLAEKGNGYVFRDAWMRSMDSIVKFNPALLKNGTFTDSELAGYSAWREAQNNIRKRRSIGDKESSDLEEAYPHALFIDHTLEEMRNPSLMSDRDQTYLGANIQDLVAAYFGDITTVLHFRPDLKEQVYDQISAAERNEYEAWVQSKYQAIKTEVNLASRVPYLKNLLGLKFMSDDTFNMMRDQLIRANLDQLDEIYNTAVEINRIAITGSESPKNAKIDPETGEIIPISEAETDKALSDHIDSLVMNSMMQSVVNAATGKEMSQYGAKVTDDMGFAEDKEGSFRQIRDTKAEEADASMNSNTMSIEDMERSQERSVMDEDLSSVDLMNSGYDVDMGDMTGFDDIDPALRQGLFSGGLTNKLVQTYVAKITNKWKNAPQIVVLSSHYQLPPALRDKVSAKLSEGMGAKGMFDPATGVTYLFSDYLTGEADTQFTLFHEVYGHLGMRAFQGAEFDQFLENMYNANEVVRKAADALIARGGIGKLQAIDETLSDMAGDNREVSAVTEWIGKSIAGLRKIGLDKLADWIGKLTSAELSYSLQMAKQYAEEGGYSPLHGAPDDIRLAEGKLPYEVFAIKGDNTHAYARYNPLTREWYLFTNKNGDIRKDSNVSIFQDYDELTRFMNRFGKLERRMRSSFFRDNKIPADYVQFEKSARDGRIKSFFGGAVRALQNQYRPVFQAVEQMAALGRVSEDLDLRMDLRLSERQTAVDVEDANREFVTPIMQLVAEAKKAKGEFTEGVDNVYDMLNKFLLAQTADERNKQVNKRSPENFKGSGMGSKSSNLADPSIPNEADAILDFVKTQPYAEQFEAIGKLLDQMSAKKIQWEVDTGLISKKEGAQRQAAYQHYRNLSGLNSDLDSDHSSDPALNIGRKFNLRGKDKNALGRSDEAPDILARTMLGYEASIIRGHKNQIAQKVLRFFETNYDPNLVTINEQSKIKKVGADGFVQLVDNDHYINQPDVMVAKVKGIPVTIRFKDQGYNSIGEAIHGKIYPAAQNRIMHTWGVMTRFSGQLITTYNPFWIPVNFAKDVQTLFLNSAVNGEVGSASAGRMMKELVPAIGTSLRVALEDMQPATAAGRVAQKSLMKVFDWSHSGIDMVVGKSSIDRMAIYREARKAGALTSFINRKDLDEQIIQINEAIRGKSAISKIQGMLKFMELMTVPMEMAPRLAAYTVLTQQEGWTSKKSADYAGRVTVDFNMRGAYEPVRTLYLFFNPAIQGTAQMFELAKKNPARMAALGGALMSAGFIISAMTRAAGDDDEYKKKSGKNVLDDIPVYKRATSVIINPNEKWGAAPLPYGWNVFYAAGAFMADSVYGDTPMATTLKRIFNAAFDAYSPVGGSGFDALKIGEDPFGEAKKLLTPTLITPPMQWEMNKNRFGGPIHPDAGMTGREGFSDTTNAFSSVNPMSKKFTEWLQESTGGNRFNQKGIDISPALIDHMVQGYAPGLASEMYKAAGNQMRKEMGLDIPREKEPLQDRFAAYPAESADAMTYRRVAAQVKADYEELRRTPTDDPRRAEILKEHPNIGTAEMVIKSVDQSLRGIRSGLHAAEQKAYQLRKDGQVEDANKMDKQVVDLTNQVKAAEKAQYSRATQAFIKAGYKDLVVSNE